MPRFLVLLLLLASCALNPLTQRRELVVLSEARERELGREQAREITADLGEVDDARLTALVSNAGERIARQSPRRGTYQFHLLDAAEPNAFALPSGDIYLTRGLLALTNTEDELAAVLAHEVVHVAGRHAVQRLTRMAPFALVTNLASALSNLPGSPVSGVVGGLGLLAGGLLLTPYSREQEAEADRVGQQLVAAAGLDPGAVPRVLETLERERRLAGKGARRLRFLDSHPANEERIAATQRGAAELSLGAARALTPSREAFLEQLAGLVVGPRAASGVFEGQTLQHPGLGITLRFPRQWRLQQDRRQTTAVAPSRAAVIVFEVAAQGTDPAAGIGALEHATGVALADRVQPAQVGTLRAARVSIDSEADGGPVVLDIVWVAHAGQVLQLSGLARRGELATMRAAFEETVQSLRPLLPNERATIRENRLRIVHARGGETLEQICDRSRSTWSPEMIAIANGLRAGDRLTAGATIKVPVAEPYRP